MSAVEDFRHREWLQREFDRCWPFLEPALAYAGNTFGREHVWRRIFVEQRAQLWPGTTAAVVTTIETHPDASRSLIGWLAGGELDEVQRLEAQIRPWAKKMGCVRIRIIGRRGWLRGLDAYREVATIMETDL